MLRRYPCVRQTGQSDCGAAALATIALHYRRPIAFQQLRDLAGTDRIGTNLRGLLQAETLGFSAKGVKGSSETLRHVPLPAIAHVKTEEGRGHFVVLHRVKQALGETLRPQKWPDRGDRRRGGGRQVDRCQSVADEPQKETLR